MGFIETYSKAETLTDIIMCFVAKILGAKVVTPLGRIKLLPKDYEYMAIMTGNEDLLCKRSASFKMIERVIDNGE